MKCNGHSKFAVFVYQFLAFELVGQLILSLLPTDWQNWFISEFVLRGILWLSLFALLIRSFVQISRNFRTRKFLVLIPFLILAARVICIPMVFQFGQTAKFFLAQKMYEEVVHLVENDSIQVTETSESEIYNYAIAPSSYWYIGGGKGKHIQIIERGKRNLILFEVPSFDGYCGFLYSSNGTYTQKILSYQPHELDRFLKFQPISKNWFYGCVFIT